MNNTEKLTGEQIIELLKSTEINISSFAYEDLDLPNDFSEAALEAQKVKDEWIKDNPHPKYGTDEYKEWAKKYDSFPSKYDIQEKEWKIANNIPEWEEVEQYGGEGQGSTWYSVKYFPQHDVYIRVDGHYESYNGTDFYDDWDSCSIVRPKEKTITVYETC